MDQKAINNSLEKLILLGDPRLYQICEKVNKSDLHHLESWKSLMHKVMKAVRAKYRFGRAIAAPQVGIMKRVVYLNIDKPILILNPVIENRSDEMIELWDDCMSFPNLLVRLKRHKSIRLRFQDENFNERNWDLQDDLSELLQHECDHLDGILCPMRAIDNKSFKWRSF